MKSMMKVSEISEYLGHMKKSGQMKRRYVPITQLKLPFTRKDESENVQAILDHIQQTQTADDYPFEMPDGEECPF